MAAEADMDDSERLSEISVDVPVASPAAAGKIPAAAEPSSVIVAPTSWDDGASQKKFRASEAGSSPSEQNVPHKDGTEIRIESSEAEASDAAPLLKPNHKLAVDKTAPIAARTRKPPLHSSQRPALTRNGKKRIDGGAMWTLVTFLTLGVHMRPPPL